MKQVAGIMQSLVRLKQLDVSSNGNSTKGAKAISEKVKDNCTLQHLAISWNNNSCTFRTDMSVTSSKSRIKDIGTTIIAEILHNNNLVATLDISHNKISYKGAKYISNLLLNNCALREINISHNNIAKEGMLSIAESLKTSCSLEKLNVAHNNISD